MAALAAPSETELFQNSKNDLIGVVPRDDGGLVPRASRTRSAAWSTRRTGRGSYDRIRRGSAEPALRIKVTKR